MSPTSVVVLADRIHVSFLPPVTAEALLVTDGVVALHGTRAEVTAAAPSGARVLDLAGTTVIPGLVESHAHTMFTGMTSRWADLRPERVTSVGAIADALRSFGVSGDWFIGWGYDDSMLAERRHPERADLDAVSEEHPVLVTHLSGHFGAANSVALRLAGVGPDTPDPDGGVFVRDAAGRHTGVLKGVGAVRAVRGLCPPATREIGADAVRETVAKAASRGVTQIHDLAIGHQLAGGELGLYRELDLADELPARIVGYLRGDLAADALAEDPELFRRREGRRFTVAGVKLWSDGSIQGLTGALSEDYHCCAGISGELLLDADQIVERATPWAEAGAQLAVHANGDRAITEVIEAFRRLPNTTATGAPHRIEHFQTATASQVRAAADLGVGASLFSNHVHYWGDRHRDLFLGPTRAERLDPLRDCLEAGVTVGVHSDSPVTPLDMLKTLQVAVSRRTSAGEVLGAAQGVTPAEALHVATASSARLVGLGDTLGTLRAGQAADLVALDRDPVADLTGEALGSSQVALTMVAGRVTYEQ